MNELTNRVNRQRFFQAWLNKREVQEHDVLEPLFECVFDEVYTYVKQSLSPKMDVLECNVITQVCAAQRCRL